MGNCCERCFGKFDKRRYLRTRYNVERDISIEFENLMDEESQDNEHSRNASPIVTEQERILVRSQQYSALVEEQKLIDDKLWQELVQQEDELRREEEAYYQARGVAARTTRSLLKKEVDFQHHRLPPSTMPYHKSQGSWFNEDESNWDIAGNDDDDDDDFESFLECVKARSAASRNHANNLLVPDVASDDDRSKTEASSIDLEWEHEAGMQPIESTCKKNHYSTSNDDETKPSLQTDKLSGEFEWDNDFVTGPSHICSKIDSINNNISSNTNCVNNQSATSTPNTIISIENVPPR